MCEFRVVLVVEPPALAGKKNGAEKSKPADEISFLFFKFKYYLIGIKKDVNKNDRMLHEEIFAAHSKI